MMFHYQDMAEAGHMFDQLRNSDTHEKNPIFPNFSQIDEGCQNENDKMSLKTRVYLTPLSEV